MYSVPHSPYAFFASSLIVTNGESQTEENNTYIYIYIAFCFWCRCCGEFMNSLLSLRIRTQHPKIKNCMKFTWFHSLQSKKKLMCFSQSFRLPLTSQIIFTASEIGILHRTPFPVRLLFVKSEKSRKYWYKIIFNWFSTFQQSFFSGSFCFVLKKVNFSIWLHTAREFNRRIFN